MCTVQAKMQNLQDSSNPEELAKVNCLVTRPSEERRPSKERRQSKARGPSKGSKKVYPTEQAAKSTD